MRFARPTPLVAVVTLLAMGGCLQLDQQLPLDVDSDEAAAQTIGPSGGTVSVPPDFSMRVPPGALTSSASITVQRRLTSPFPTEAGAVLPGTSYDVGPAGLTLATSAKVALRVPESLLGEGDDVRLAVAVLGNDGSVTTSSGLYDATAGFLTAQIPTLGPVAAVVEVDAIDVETGLPPGLDGGNFGGAGSGVEGLVESNTQGTRYASQCAPSARRCFSSGLIRAWISPNLTERLGSGLAIVSPSLSAELDFSGFDASGQPTSVIGSVTVKGSLKVRVGQSVSSYEIDEQRFTGPSSSASATGVSISGNVMTFDQIFGGDERVLEFGLTRIATGELLTVKLTEEVELENDDGSTTDGTVTIHVRLRR